MELIFGQILVVVANIPMSIFSSFLKKKNKTWKAEEEKGS